MWHLLLPLTCLSLSAATRCSSLRPSPPNGPLHRFQSAGTGTRCCTEASAQVSPSWQPLAESTASVPRLHSAKSEWDRVACTNSCSGSDQKKERELFDYSLFVRRPLKLPYSPRPLCEWAASQRNAQGNNQVFLGVEDLFVICVFIF